MANNFRDNFVLLVGSVGLAVITIVIVTNSDKIGPQQAPSPMRTTVQPAVSPSMKLTEDDPSWNCWTDGNGVCGGRTYVPIPEPQQRLLKEYEDPDRDWSKCTWSVGDTTYVHCADGYTGSIS